MRASTCWTARLLPPPAGNRPGSCSSCSSYSCLRIQACSQQVEARYEQLCSSIFSGKVSNFVKVSTVHCCHTGQQEHPGRNRLLAQVQSSYVSLQMSHCSVLLRLGRGVVLFPSPIGLSDTSSLKACRGACQGSCSLDSLPFSSTCWEQTWILQQL